MTATREQDVVELLVDQHNQIRRLFSEMDGAQGDRKREVFEDLVRLLAIHETAEEEVVHPVAGRRIEGGQKIVEERLHEEDQAKHMLAELYDLGPDKPEFDVRFQALKNAVIQHAEREEQQEFSTLREKVDKDTLKRMADAVRAAEKTAPTRPHPRTPESAVGNILAGPPLAVFDRVRDKMRELVKSGKGNR
ncbi:hemerythrin domain-containing protein [Planosporangium flavigriseum]|uniref:Hemerythrin n=1 Tax=Planosporangium flavigriseum TaxID=373681 RepID=A0A8J3LQ02_9ACTN|nr:hemerythrin domain-containing protein [Planosporangium flavigriseum]NJC66004.1 hemerythrin domain-containing protein [Planosporangium flavigriseum]GIG74533.1 hemerythrin [Planosporangium flavigriseum]